MCRYLGVYIGGQNHDHTANAEEEKHKKEVVQRCSAVPSTVLYLILCQKPQAVKKERDTGVGERCDAGPSTTFFLFSLLPYIGVSPTATSSVLATASKGESNVFITTG